MSDVTDLILQQSVGETDERGGGVPGVLVDGGFWHWQQLLSEDSIRYRRSLQSARTYLRHGAYALASLSGLGGAGWLSYLAATSQLSPDFLAMPTFPVGLLGAGVLLGLFVWYRGRAQDRLRVDLKAIGRVTAPEATTIPSLAAVERRFDIATVCDDDTLTLIEEAYRLAAHLKHAQVEAIHFFGASLSTTAGAIVLARLGLKFDDLRESLQRRLANLMQGVTRFGAPAETLLTEAMLHALRTRRRTISALDFMAVAVREDDFLQELFAAKGTKLEELENVLAWMRIRDDLRQRYLDFQKAAAFKPTNNMNRSMTAVATPFLDSVSEDLTREAVYGRTELLIGRDTEMATIMRAIEGGGQSVVLVGPSGVGKQAIIEGIADLMVEERVPKVLQDKRLLKLSVPHIVSAQGGTGAEERLLYALQQVARSGNVVLVIEDLHALVGRSGGVDLASILASELAKGYTFVIATTTPQDYAEIVERSILSPKFQKIIIREPERNDAIQVVEAKLGLIEARHKVIFTYAAVAATVELSSRYLHESMLPEKAIELAKETALMVSKRGQPSAWVKKDDVAQIVGERTRIPVTEVSQDEGQKLLHLEERVHARVIGQEHAVKSIAAALRRARTELRSGSRPIANFLFLGPTGVGKTELAKATAEVYFGHENAMIRFDMSEYQDQASVTRLIGGTAQAGLLTEAVRKNPFALVLLDELEKAHPDILNLFLQVMDDGRLTDGFGRTVDFTNVILIATSNAGTQFIQDQVAAGMPLDTIRQSLLDKELRSLYRPEFLNRFDDVIVFSPLTMEDVVAIAYLMINKVRQLVAAKGMTLQVTDAAVHELAEAGYDPNFGARPLRRVIQEKLENPLAEYLLRGEVGRRDTIIFDRGSRLSVQKAPEL